jgi:2-hydroxychromene-2-carboxylate isomerase
MAQLEFWYDLASPYAYLTALRIEDEAAALGVDIDWRPFLLGPIFQAQGWNTSPFNVYPAKGRYMVRDITRTAEVRGLVFRMPDPFPASSINAARVALIGKRDGWCARFTRAALTAEFDRGEDISSLDVLRQILIALGVDADAALAAANSPENKERLRRETELAQTRGIFGSPSFVTGDGELFWGDDRLEQALRWATRK